METTQKLNFLNALLPLALIVFIIAIGVVLLNQHFQKNLYLQKIERETLKGMHQNELLRSSIHVQEEERKRIAQDIHDELGAVLSIMRMHLIMLEDKNADDSGNILSGIKNARQLSENALTSIRNISHRLMPPQLEQFGLIKTLKTVVEQINDAGKINIRLAPMEGITGLPWSIDLGLYRITLELINNTIKHADAKNIMVIFGNDSQYLTCVYTDDGKGLSAPEQVNGLGLKSIEGRASSLGGIAKFGNSITRSGFNAIIKIPLANNG